MSIETPDNLMSGNDDFDSSVEERGMALRELVQESGAWAKEWVVDHKDQIKKIPKRLVVDFFGFLKKSVGEKIAFLRKIKLTDGNNDPHSFVNEWDWESAETEGGETEEFFEHEEETEVNPITEHVDIITPELEYENKKRELEALLDDPSPGIVKAVKKELDKLETERSLRGQAQQLENDFKTHQEKWGKETPDIDPPTPIEVSEEIEDDKKEEAEDNKRRRRIESMRIGVEDSVRHFVEGIDSQIDELKTKYNYEAYLKEKRDLLERMLILETDINDANKIINQIERELSMKDDSDLVQRINELKKIVRECQAELNAARKLSEKLENKTKEANKRIAELMRLKEEKIPEGYEYIPEGKEGDIKNRYSFSEFYRRKLKTVSDKVDGISDEKIEKNKKGEYFRGIFEVFSKILLDLDNLDLKDLDGEMLEYISTMKKLIKEAQNNKEISFLVLRHYVRNIFEKLEKLGK